MKEKLLVMIIAIGLFIVPGCGKTDAIENALQNQKIIFIMSVSSYAEPYAAGYFIDANGEKHIYELLDRRPFESIEAEYAYLLAHYDEFDVSEFFDADALRRCAEYLYLVDANAGMRTEGTAIADAPSKQLYGIRLTDGREEFVLLGSEPGISERLNDPAADKIFEEFGERWYLLNSIK